MLNFRVCFPIELFAATVLITDCHSPLKTKRWHYYGQKKHNQIVLTELKSKKLSGKPTQQLHKSLGTFKRVNNSGSQLDWGKLETKIQFKISQSVCLIAVNS